jgi:hypothetical protein
MISDRMLAQNFMLYWVMSRAEILLATLKHDGCLKRLKEQTNKCANHFSS